MDHSLRWLLTLVETENVTDAAAELGMSQPTLSRRLQSLEHEVGGPLFDRPGRRLLLNEAGRIYADAAERAELTLQVAVDRIHELRSGSPTTLRLGFLHSFGPWLVPQVLRHVEATFPGVRHHLIQDAADTIGHLVVAGDLDIGIISPRPAAGGPLAWQPLLQQPICVAVALDHPLADRSALSMHDVSEETFVTMPPHYGMRKVLDDAAATAGFTPRIGTECQELGTVAGLVAAGLGIALLPQERHREPSETIRLVPLTRPSVSREIGLVWARGRSLPPVAEALRHFSS